VTGFGLIAGRYRIAKELGSGSSGTVYSATDERRGEPVAVKIMHSGTLFRFAEFGREAQVGAHLHHPNIVRISDVGQSEGFGYVAMELVEGPSLRDVIRSDGPIPARRAAALGSQVAAALGYAHDVGVIHADIKPGNILIEPGDRIKVTDFGITAPKTQCHPSPDMLGTPSYMSPEQARGDKLTGRSDLFSLGSVLYEMLTGQQAFTDESITGLLFKVITETPTPIRQLAPDVPEALAVIIDQALMKDATARPASGQQLSRALQGFVRR